MNVETCRAFMASLKGRGKDGEDAKGLLVTQLRNPEAFVIWHKAESYQPKETTAEG